MIRFGTDGWRAILGEEFTFANVEKVAQAYADILTSPPAPLLTKERVAEGRVRSPIPLGFDRRFLSEEFAKSFASVLAANHVTVLMSRGYCPAPCISWMTKAKESTGAVIITASHNPAAWNGIKFKERLGVSASPLFTRTVEQRIETNEREAHHRHKIPFEEAVRQGRIQSFDPFADYARGLRSQVDIRKIQDSPWKTAFDPLFGAGAGFLEKVLERPVQEIHSEENPSFGGLNPEPIEKNLGPLIRLVKENRLDVGLSTDGDADRIGAVDENGRFVNAGQIFALILQYLIERGERGDVVKTVSTTQMINRIAAKRGLKVWETPIGFKHICEKFTKGGCLIGGEESGGIGLPSHIPERDGLLCALFLLEMMSVKKKRLGELIKDLEREIGPSSFLREDVHLPLEKIEEAREKIRQKETSKIGPIKVVQVNRLDGLKYLLEDDSWLLIRPSGTEPLVRIYAEASSLEQVRQLISEGRRLIGLT